MRRPQFTLRALLVLMLAVACFFAGMTFDRERRRRQDEARKLVPEFKLSREAAAMKAAKKAVKK